MLLEDIFSPPVNGLQDVNSDNSRPVYRTSRKTKLTLRQIRKLRRMLDVRTFEKQQYLEKLRKQYGTKPAVGVPGAPSL
jgi:hypothetical protein